MLPSVACAAVPGAHPMISCGWCARRDRGRRCAVMHLPTAPRAITPRTPAAGAHLLFCPLILSTMTTGLAISFAPHVLPCPSLSALRAAAMSLVASTRTRLHRALTPASRCASSAPTMAGPAPAAALSFFLSTGHLWAPTTPRGALRAACYSTLPYAAVAPAPESCATPRASPTASRTVRRASLFTRVPGTRATPRTTALVTRMTEALELTMPRRRRPPTRATRTI